MIALALLHLHLTKFALLLFGGKQIKQFLNVLLWKQLNVDKQNEEHYYDWYVML